MTQLINLLDPFNQDAEKKNLENLEGPFFNYMQKTFFSRIDESNFAFCLPKLKEA